MAQSSLTPGPGTIIRDALEHDLTAEGIVEVEFPCIVSFWAGWEAGAAGEVTELEGASNLAFDEDVVSYGAIVSEAAETTTGRITAAVYRQYVRVTSDGTLDEATLRLVHDRID